MSLDGEVARVSATIKPNEEGEVMVQIQGGTQAFPARSYDPKAEFAKGERVVVLEQAGRVLYVSAVT
jgi:membrane protein implicated in regulation of membrane protease activity